MIRVSGRESIAELEQAQNVEMLLRELLASLNYQPSRTTHENLHETVMVIHVDGFQYQLTCTPPAPAISLSPREQEVVKLVARGFPNKSIANVLDISPCTVSTHLRRIFAKLGVGSRAEMVARILQ
ncbi:MAG: LuxR C-terminal-related transcriptional regulator [Anaerolineae bacterium]|nr:LuxR C-terminal-related transcriptional regulator [Anaerolineae bacterium]